MPTDTEAHIQELLGENGRVAELLPTFEVRQGQLELSIAVAQVLESGGVLAAEAPTGIGKSLAYLVPAALHAVIARLPVVIATHTRNLQDQLIDKDVPLLEQTIAPWLTEPLRVTVVKGRANYLCRRRWELARTGELGGEPLPAGRRGSLEQWVAATRAGDLSEAEEWVGALGPWRARLGADSIACNHVRCGREAECFLRRLRDEARTSHLVIVNHALLFSHLQLDSPYLPDADALVLDEAHRVEEVLTRIAGRQIDGERLGTLQTRTVGTPAGEGGELERLARRLALVPSQVDRLNLLERVGQTRQAVEQGAAALGRFLRELAPRATALGELPLRYGPDDRPGVAATEELFGIELEPVHRLLVEGAASLQQLLGALEPVNAQSSGSLDASIGELAAIASGWAGLSNDLAALAAPDDHDVCWVERDVASGVALRSQPLAVGDWMEELVLARYRATILTSATLTVAGSFDHLVERLALDRRDPRGLHLIQLETPFDYHEAARLLVDPAFPSPNDPAYGGAVADALLQLAAELDCRMLVLFTSWRLLRAVHRRLEPICAELGRPLLAQGIDGPRRVIAHSHRKRRGSILLGTQSFWEGVDFPGEELELLVITRLPFPVPSEPLVAARSDRLRDDGRQPFTELFLPEAVLRFRQGFGRLIRSRSDRGAVLCFDRRLSTSSYGRTFLDSLPIPAEVVEPGGLAGEVLAWLGRADGRQSAPE